MTKDKKIKIGDMGMSIIFDEEELIHSRVGTPLYIAPELVKKEKYDYKIDIWSLGCSLYHLAKTVPPFTDENLIKLGNSIINEQPSNLPICYSNELYDFILRLMIKNKDQRPSALEALELIPEKIKKKFYNNYNIYTAKKKKFKYENGKLIEKQNIINKENKFQNKLDDFSNNNGTTINSDKYFSKSLKNDNEISNKYDNALVSGQTFYQFFKVNNTKYKNNNKFSEIKNNETTINNANINNPNLLILSKTMFHMKDFYKTKIPENTGIKTNIVNNIKALKLMKEITQEKANINIKQSVNKENKEIEIIDNNNLDVIDKDKFNNINSCEIYKHNLDKFRNDEKKNNKNISMSMDKYMKNQDINNFYIKNIHEPTRTFLMKDAINKNNTIFVNRMKLINKKYQIDIKKEETIFPKIQNRYKFKSNSMGKYKNYQDIQNFGHTEYPNQYRNKLTIHDLK
jgi:hypothetical protein